MPGPLTWRDVATPHFDTGPADYARIGAMLNHAFDGIQNVVNEADANKTNAVNNAILMELSKYQDPEAAKAALQSGAIFDIVGAKNRDRISADTIKAAEGIPTALYDQQGKKLNNEFTGEQIIGAKDTNKYNTAIHEQGIKDQAAEVAARPLYSQILDAATMQKGETDYSGATARVKAITSNPDNAAIIAALPSDKQVKLRTDPLDYAIKALQPESTLLNNEQTRASTASTKASTQGELQRQTFAREDQTWKREDRQAESDAAAVYSKASIYANGDPGRIKSFIESAGLGPRAKAAAIRQLAESFPGFLKPEDLNAANPGGAAGASAALAGSDTVVGHGLITDVLPGAIITGGERSVEHNKDVGGAKASHHLPGDGWETYDVRAYSGARNFNDAKAAMERKYGAANVQAIDETKKTNGTGPHWHFAVNVAALGLKGKGQGQNEADPSNFGSTTATYSRAVNSTRAAIAQSDPTGLYRSWYGAQGSDPNQAPADPLTVVAQLKKTPGYEKVDDGYLLRLLEKVHSESGGNYSQAAEVLKRNVHKYSDGSLIPFYHGGWSGTVNRLSERSKFTHIGGDLYFDDAGASKTAAELNSKTGRATIDKIARLSGGGAEVNQAFTAVQYYTNRYQNALLRAETDPSMKAIAAQELGHLRAAQQQLNTKLAEAAGNEPGGLPPGARVGSISVKLPRAR